MVNYNRFKVFPHFGLLRTRQKFFIEKSKKKTLVCYKCLVNSFTRLLLSFKRHRQLQISESEHFKQNLFIHFQWFSYGKVNTIKNLKIQGTYLRFQVNFSPWVVLKLINQGVSIFRVYIVQSFASLFPCVHLRFNLNKSNCRFFHFCFFSGQNGSHHLKFVLSSIRQKADENPDG